MSLSETLTVLLTDRAWPDDGIEREVLEAAGMHLVCGPASAAGATVVEELVAEHQPAAIMTCWAPVSQTAIAQAAKLRHVARMGVGLDNIAVQAATERGVLVTNVPDYCIDEVSDHALALALSWTRGIAVADRQVRAGRWEPAAAKLHRLRSLHCGVIGFGRIGRATAHKLRAFGATVVASDPAPPAGTDGVAIVALDELLSSCEIVILHAPLLASTKHMIGVRELALMPRGSFLINVSRGGLVDNRALLDALQVGHLAGAGLDVLDGEPRIPDGLLEHPQVIVTPHVGFSSADSVAELRRKAAEEVVRVLSDQPPRCPCNRPIVPSANGARP
jgi:D-3-phosphoglycerate dehydrogenase